MKAIKYRKKPVIIDAMVFEYSNEGINELLNFANSAIGNISKDRHMNALGQCEIGTLEDGSGELIVKHIATEGDYVIRGIAGEYYACKPDIFLNSYDLVED